MALGCDQKKASIQPVRAPISHSAMAPTRMPICTVTSAQVGQSFCTGRRRTGFRPRARADCLRRQIEARRCVHGAGVLNRHRLLLATAQAAWFMAATGAALALSSSRQRSLMARKSGVSALVRTRGRGERDRDGLDDAARPRAHDVDLVGEIDRLLDVVGDEHARSC